MDQNLDNSFILKGRKINDILILLNNKLKNKLRNSDFYFEDKKNFNLDSLNLKVNNFIRTKKLLLKESSIYPSFVILKSKKINDIVLEKDEWLIISFSLFNEYQSEKEIYVFSVS